MFCDYPTYFYLSFSACRNGQSVFCSVLLNFVSSNLPWNTLPEDVFSSVLDHIAADYSLIKLSAPLVNLLSSICCLKSLLNIVFVFVYFLPLITGLKTLVMQFRNPCILLNERRIQLFLQNFFQILI